MVPWYVTNAERATRWLHSAGSGRNQFCSHSVTQAARRGPRRCDSCPAATSVARNVKRTRTSSHSTSCAFSCVSGTLAAARRKRVSRTSLSAAAKVRACSVRRSLVGVIRQPRAAARRELDAIAAHSVHPCFVRAGGSRSPARSGCRTSTILRLTAVRSRCAAGQRGEWTRTPYTNATACAGQPICAGSRRTRRSLTVSTATLEPWGSPNAS